MTAESGLRRATRARISPRRELLIFVGSAALTLLVISLGTVLIVTQVARTVALHGAEDTTTRLADLVVGPLLGEALDGDAGRRDELDRAVANRLEDGSLTGISVWRADGEVVYDSDPGRIGRRFPPVPEITRVIGQGVMISDISSAAGSGPPDGRPHRTISVYVPLQVTGQPTLAFEARYSYERVQDAAERLLRQILPLLVGALLVLQLVQVPIAVSLARRVARQEAERATLLERALSASDRERRQIAADLHDGVIQDLAGAGYALAALARSVPPERADTAERVGSVVRGAVDSLRSLMVHIYPPDLTGAGLPGAVADLVRPLRERGVAVSVEVGPLPPVDPEEATTLYRVAREALTNVDKHAKAHTVRVSLVAQRAKRRPGVLLQVMDDGVGLPADALDHRAEGHLGLHLLIDRIADLGGELTVHRVDDRGTVVEAWVPAAPPG